MTCDHCECNEPFLVGSPHPPSEERQDGAALIVAERTRQQMVEGWSEAHDDDHDCGEMGQAAICYIDHAAPNDWESHPQWPWSREWWKPSDDPIRDLVKAGALIAAEIDRWRRLAPPVSPGTKED